MTKLIMQQALESIEAHAAHTISLIESNEMNVMTLYFRIDSIQTAARNALNAAKKEEKDLLEEIEYWKLEVFPQRGAWIDGVWHDTTWRACKYPFPTDMSSLHRTVREAVENVVEKIKNKENK